MSCWSCAAQQQGQKRIRSAWPKLSSFPSDNIQKKKKKKSNLIFLRLHQLSTSPVISVSFSQNNCSRPLQTRVHQCAHSISYPSLHQHPIHSLPSAPHWPESLLKHTCDAQLCSATAHSFENWKLLGKKYTLRVVSCCGRWNPTWHTTAGLQFVCSSLGNIKDFTSLFDYNVCALLVIYCTETDVLGHCLASSLVCALATVALCLGKPFPLAVPDPTLAFPIPRCLNAKKAFQEICGWANMTIHVAALQTRILTEVRECQETAENFYLQTVVA